MEFKRNVERIVREIWNIFNKSPDDNNMELNIFGVTAVLSKKVSWVPGTTY